MSCIQHFNFYAICGHSNQTIKHSEHCKNPGLGMQRYREGDLELKGHPNMCWTPLPPKIRPEYYSDVCGRPGCNENRVSPDILELRRLSSRNKLELWEKANRYIVRNEAKKNEFMKDARVLSYRMDKLAMEHRLGEQELELKVIDLTLPREKILEGYLVAVDPKDVAFEPPEEECMICSVEFKDAPMDADGGYLKNEIKGQGVVRQMPCECYFHLECIIRTLVTITSDPPDNGVGNRCPRCQRDTRVRFAVFNGVEEPTKRWFPIDGMPNGGMRFIVDGYLDLEETVVHRRTNYMRVVPFRTLEDKWGYFVSRAQAGA